ncbi:MAG: phosphatase PAP2 family protein [Pseudolabrys sp.]|nr:phosphatase PAP2 family protein [Pseudolabrys sp.]
MNRTGLLLALAAAVIGGAIFGFYPQLDISISRALSPTAIGFPRPTASMDFIRDLCSLIIGGLAAVGFVAIALKLILPLRPMIVPARAAVLLIVTIALGPGLMTNVILKDNWGRARPYAVKEFGGPEKFTPWWDPRGACTGNCSFIAGEPSGAFWTLAPAAVLAPPQWRVAAYGAAVAFGVGVGVARIAFGAHFASDVLFAGVLTFLLIWLVHGLLYRFAATRISESKLEAIIGGVTRPLWTLVSPPARGRKRLKKKRPARRKARRP